MTTETELDGHPHGTLRLQMVTARARLTRSPVEWRCLFAALVLVPVVRLALWFLPSSTSLALVRRLAALRPRTAGRLESAQPAIRAVRAVSRRVPGATCLTQAVAARLLLAAHGIDSELCVGVARDARGTFRAHAWLEREEQVILGASESLRFTRMPGFGLAEMISNAPHRP